MSATAAAIEQETPRRRLGEGPQKPGWYGIRLCFALFCLAIKGLIARFFRHASAFGKFHKATRKPDTHDEN